MNCEQARELAALAASGDVTTEEERLLASHMDGCGECRAEAQAFEALRDRLAGMRLQALPDSAYTAVRARVLGKIGERRVGWAILSPAFAVVVACTVILAIVLDPEKPIVTAPARQPAALVAAGGIRDITPVIAAPEPARRIRRAARRAKAQDAVEPLVVHFFTDDPDVVIYWIADGRGSTAEKEIIQ